MLPTREVRAYIARLLGLAPRGWRDMIGQITPQSSGAGIPLWQQITGGTYYGWNFGVNDACWVTYHVQHDYAPGTDIYLHTHWIQDATSTDTVKWEFTWSFAKGYNQTGGTFDNTGTVVTVETAGPGIARRHMISEIAVPISSTDFEVDGLLLVKIRRITNGGTNNANNIFLLTADCHYQCDTFATKNRVVPFYT